MTSPHIADLLKLLGAPTGGALLRFSPGREHLGTADFQTGARS
jgi:hypothetical protein